MRSLLLLAAVLAACRGPRAPAIAGAPDRLLESTLDAAGGDPADRTLRRCLFVANHTRETVAVFVDGRHVGWVGPRSSVGFYVGRSAGAKTHLRATCDLGAWEETVHGPVWDVTWSLRRR